MGTLFKNKYVFGFILITTILFFGRILFFVGSYGGVEHDSGWYLGVAKNLAERGIYASYTNTIIEEGVTNAPSIHGRFSVQDEKGYSYFPAGVTVGPGYIVPEALILKIFGSGWWQFRAWPLAIFLLLLLLLFSFIYTVGGLPALMIFQVWLYVVPQFYISYSFEAFSESIAFFFIFLSFLFYDLSFKKKTLVLIILSGLFYSFAILTKNLFLLPGLIFIPFFTWKLKDIKNIKNNFIRLLLFIFSLFLPILLFEGYRYFVLLSGFGSLGYDAINKDISLTFQQNGSGLANIFTNLNLEFISNKVKIWLDVGIGHYALFWIILFLSFIPTYKMANKKYSKIITILFLSMTISFFWFIFISPTGWARHAWQAIMIGMILISIFLGLTYKKILARKKFYMLPILLLLIILFTRRESLDFNYFLTETDIYQWRTNRFIRNLEGFPSTPILSLRDQEELLNYFNKNIKKNDSVYYLGWFLNSEASAITGKVFFPLDRYLSSQKDNSYLILGPYQKGIWSLMPPDYVPLKKTLLCQDVVFENNSYTLCKLKKGLVYSNLPYQ